MSDMDELVAWLREQLDDDERVARAVDGQHWSIEQPEPGDPSWYYPQLLGKSLIKSCDPASLTPAEGEHIVRWDPARVLAEVDAKRRILDQLGMWLRGHDPERASEFPGTTGGVAAMLTVVRTLALPYADRAGYREEWRP